MAAKYRADHVGSLLRPPELLAARQAHKEGRITDEQLREVEDRSVLAALEMQRQAGVDVLTDGEYRRGVWYGPLSNGLEGFVDDPERASFFQNIRGGRRLWQGRGSELAEQTLTEVGEITQVVGGKLRKVGRMTDGEAAFLKRHAPGPWKTTMPGVFSRVGMWFKAGLSDQFYPTRQDLVRELVGFMQAEVRLLLEEGVSYFQLDSLTYAMGPASSLLGQNLDEVIAADNAVIEVAKAGGATVGLHVCRGNNRSAWASEGSYEPAAERAFSELKCDRFLLEYDTERAGGFEPLRFMPKDKVVVLGLISSKEPALEEIDDLRGRIDEAAKYVPFENLAISPQCGFASTAPGNLLTWDDQRRKLELVAETARKVWG